MVGDGANGGAGGRAVADMIATRRIDRFVYLGDVYPTGTASDFQNNYEPLFGRFNALASPVIGNHEWANRAVGYLPYWGGVLGRPARLHYSFKLAGWQLIVLDSNAPADPAQLSWLKRRIKRGTFGGCRIALMHHPRFSASTGHGDDPAIEPLWAALRGRTRLVVAGHDHTMQRLRPIRGTRLVISGAGGISLYPLRDDPRAAFADASRYGALRLALKPGRAVAKFVSAGGQVLDRSVSACKRG